MSAADKTFVPEAPRINIAINCAVQIEAILDALLDNQHRKQSADILSEALLPRLHQLNLLAVQALSEPDADGVQMEAELFGAAGANARTEVEP